MAATEQPAWFPQIDPLTGTAVNSDPSRWFYADALGWTVDVDVAPAEGVRVVQLTPPGSACSVGIGSGLPAYDAAEPGSVHALHLVVSNMEAARRELLARDVGVGQVLDVGSGVRYAAFSDPGRQRLRAAGDGAPRPLRQGDKQVWAVRLGVVGWVGIT